MAMTQARAATPEAEPAPTPSAGTARRDRMIRWTLGAVAGACVVAAAWLPVWQARLSAPQYPAGLRLTAYGDRVVGDIAEINQLNHYVGMPAFDFSEVPEAALFLPTLGLALLGVLIATVRPRRGLLGSAARVGLWLVPIGMLADVQFRLWQFGQQVDPTAPIRLDPFLPLVVGPTKVLNFTTWAYPGEALVALGFAAFLVSAGPWLVRRWWPTGRPDAA